VHRPGRTNAMNRYLPKKLKRRQHNHWCGVNNDFLSVNKLKKYKNYNEWKYKLHVQDSITKTQKLEEEYLKKINIIEYMKNNFPQPISSQTKNERKFKKTLEKRLEHLRATEQFYPHVYREKPEFNGKLAKFQPDEQGFNSIPWVYHMVEKTYEKHYYDIYKPEKERYIYYKDVALSKSDLNAILMCTVKTIFTINEKNGKPDEIYAYQVMYNSTTFYLYYRNISFNLS
jgi:hypothetical protein